MTDFQAVNAVSQEADNVEPIAYTPATAARATGRNRTRIFTAIQAGELVARKDGKATLIERTELQRWVSSLPVIVPRGGVAA